LVIFKKRYTFPSSSSSFALSPPATASSSEGDEGGGQLASGTESGTKRRLTLRKPIAAPRHCEN